MTLECPSKGQENLALQVQQLTVNYEKVPALWDISFGIPAGKLVAVVGPNGAGKSTLLKVAMGLVRPISGNVEFFGQPLSKVRHRVAYVPQRESVDWDYPITALELVLMGRYGKLGLFRWPRKADREAALYYLEQVGMASFQDRQISQLSGGQQQRIFLARALMQEASLYLMDEPFAGVDATTECVMIELLRNLCQQGRTVIVVHHDLGTVSQYFQWVTMVNMRLVACGPIEKVFHEGSIRQAYGKRNTLFEDAVRLSKEKATGMS